jgi:uncharacterized protein (DUF302 family)
MAYYLQQTLTAPSFEAAVGQIKEALAVEGFGIICEIDVAAVLKAKTGALFRPYRILGACNPHYTEQALKAEPMIGVMLPCNVVVQQRGEVIEAAAVDPVATMSQVKDPALEPLAAAVRKHLRRAFEAAASAKTARPIEAGDTSVQSRPQDIHGRLRAFEKRLDAVIYQLQVAGLLSPPKARDVIPSSKDHLGELEREMIALKAIIPQLITFFDRPQAENSANGRIGQQSSGE